MKIKTKVLGMLLSGLAFLYGGDALAFDNPPEDDIFWQTFDAMRNPNDVTGCKAKIDELYESGELALYDVTRRRAAGQTVSDSELTDRSESHRTSLTAGYYSTCENYDEGFEIMRSSMEQYGKTSNIWDMTDWHNVNGLYFQSQDGKIYFDRTIDFMSYRFQVFMQNLPNLMMFDNGYISLNAEMVPELKNYGAVLTMYNLDFPEMPDIYIDGVLSDSSSLGAVYDVAAGTLTFNASHFSSYRAVAKGSTVKTMKIKGISKKSIKYNAKKRTFKVKARGINLKGSGVKCTLGFHDSLKAKASRKGKNVTCTFNMNGFSQTGYYPLTISVPGSGEVSRENAIRIK